MSDAPPRHRVFIVDDHALIREVVAGFVEDEPDFEVCGTAASGSEALDLIPNSNCDIVVIDVSMPEMSGIELVRRLRQQRPELKCLMLSAHTEQAYIDDSLKAGARGYVIKGNPDVLLLGLRRVLDGDVYVNNDEF